MFSQVLRPIGLRRLYSGRRTILSVTLSLLGAVPCHRVVKKDGALSGYRWGAKRKRALLEKEVPA